MLVQPQTSRTDQSGDEDACNEEPEVPCTGMEVDHEKKTVHCTATHRMGADFGEVVHYGGCHYAEKICGKKLKRKEVTIHAFEEVEGYECGQYCYYVGRVPLFAVAHFQIVDSFIQNEEINRQNWQKKCQNEEKENHFKVNHKRKCENGCR